MFFVQFFHVFVTLFRRVNLVISLQERDFTAVLIVSSYSTSIPSRNVWVLCLFHFLLLKIKRWRELVSVIIIHQSIHQNQAHCQCGNVVCTKYILRRSLILQKKTHCSKEKLLNLKLTGLWYFLALLTGLSCEYSLCIETTR